MNGIQTGYESHKHKRLSNVSQPPLPVDGNSATDESSTMHIHLPRCVHRNGCSLSHYLSSCTEGLVPQVVESPITVMLQFENIVAISNETM